MTKREARVWIRRAVARMLRHQEPWDGCPPEVLAIWDEELRRIAGLIGGFKSAPLPADPGVKR